MAPPSGQDRKFDRTIRKFWIVSGSGGVDYNRSYITGAPTVEQVYILI